MGDNTWVCVLWDSRSMPPDVSGLLLKSVNTSSPKFCSVISWAIFALQTALVALDQVCLSPNFLSATVYTYLPSTCECLWSAFYFDTTNHLPFLFCVIASSTVKISLNPDHKLHHLLPGERVNISYALWTHNRRAIPNSRTNRYKNSFIPWSLANFQSWFRFYCYNLYYVHLLTCILMF